VAVVYQPGPPPQLRRPQSHNHNTKMNLMTTTMTTILDSHLDLREVMAAGAQQRQDLVVQQQQRNRQNQQVHHQDVHTKIWDLAIPMTIPIDDYGCDGVSDARKDERTE
jgi:hypothetical protein